MSEKDENSTASSSSDDEEVEESRNAAKIEQLKGELKANPYDYDKYLALIELLRNDGELDDLREIHKKFAQHFPLTPEIWLAWISDEEKVATTNEEKLEIGKLFEKAVSDYMSVDLWQEYCQFMLWQMAVPEGVENIRATFEKALVAAGVHVSKGALLWETYREFEAALLAGDPSNEKQRAKVDKIFRRQLAVPLVNMQATLEEYKAWTNDQPIDPNVERNYKSALELLKPRQILEDQLSEDSQGTYRKYIDLELKEGNPVRIGSIYERRLTDHCLDPTHWMEYASHLEEKLKDFSKTNEVLSRAVRNCPWSGQLWIKLLRCGERNGFAKDKMCAHLETGLQAGLSSVSDIRDLWMAYIDYRRRRFSDLEEEDEKEQEDLRVIFRQALEHLATIEGDPDCKIARYWASIEADRFNNMEQSRQIWSEITMGPAGDKAFFWAEYVHLEKMFGDTKHLKKLFPRALGRTKDSPESIGELWLQFEREEGTLDSFELAEKKVNERVTEVKLQATLVSLTNEKTSSDRKRKSPQSIHEKTNNSKKVEDRKRKAPNKESSEEPVFKKPFEPAASSSKQTFIKPPPGYDEKKEDIKPPPGFEKQAKASMAQENPLKKVFVSNLDFDLTEDELKSIMSKSGEVETIHLVANYAGKSKGFAYVTFQTIDAVLNALKRDRETIKGRPMFISENDPEKKNRGHQFKYSTNMELNKLFVKGLPPKATKDDLVKLFSPYGSLKDVRLVTLRNGQSKGIAYVDFESASDASKAVVKLDNYDYQGYKMTVAISNPPKKLQKDEESVMKSLGGGAGSTFQGPRGRGRSQLSFVPSSLQKAQATNGKEEEKKEAKMSNADFRSMLLGGK